MAKINIVKKDGTPSQYFWSDKHGDQTRQTVYKQTSDGVKRMKGVYFDVRKNKLQRD